MDFLLHQIDLLRGDVDKVESRICAFEDSNKFQPHDIRYTRLLEEKKLLVENLCKLRVNVSNFGAVSHSAAPLFNVKSEPTAVKRPLESGMLFLTFLYNFVHLFGRIIEVLKSISSVADSSAGGFNSLTSTSPPPPKKIKYDAAPENISRPVIEPTILPMIENSPSPMEVTKDVPPPPIANGKEQTHQGLNNTHPSNNTASAPPTQPEPTTLPTVQMDEYLDTKMKLAQIMKDFNKKKICFLGKDGSAIHISHYQSISNRVKQGEDIGNILKGKLLVFVTAVNQKQRAITETKLFVPDFQVLVN